MQDDQNIAIKIFQGTTGDTEYFLTISAETDTDADFHHQLKYIEKRYKDIQNQYNIPPESAIFRRIFLSDVMNQAAPIFNSDLFRSLDPENPVAVSMIQQPPLCNSKIALFAYHIKSVAPLIKHSLSPKHLLVKRGELSHLWSTRLCAGSYGSSASIQAQTQDIFRNLIDVLSDQGGLLADHCVRTWIYLKNVDVFYQGMVESRSKIFTRHGLTEDTHYIASTGIEGACAHRYDLTSMDAYSVIGAKSEQISYLNDFSLLCPTKDYNVTFERGTRVAYADRSHYFISGTASIDDAGRVLYPGDVLRQLERTFINIEALLHSGSAGLDDLTYIFVYLRDPQDYQKIAYAIKERFPLLPTVIVQGAVCRPEWLIEIEGVAAKKNHNPKLPYF
ncbi:chorismate lyase / 3-hydroxybenzoate synthase [Azospirillaceae bacterium]